MVTRAEKAYAWKEAVEVAARMGELNIQAKPWGGSPDGNPGILMSTREAAVLTELASVAVRRGYSRKAAMQEIASRHPHKFEGDTNAAGLTCTECGRSEIFSNHVKEPKK